MSKIFLAYSQVALAAQRDQRRPRRGEQAARPRTVDARRRVLAARPVGHEEVLAVAQLLVAEHQDRRALHAVAVLVRVGGDRRDAGEAEVEHGDVEAEHLAERQQEPAEAAVDVQADAALEGQRGQLVDRIDRAVAVVARGSDDRRSVGVDHRGHRVDVDLRGVGERSARAASPCRAGGTPCRTPGGRSPA